MTSVEVPYSVAAALPSLAVLDITNDVAHEIADSPLRDGIAFISGSGESLVRASEREGGLFQDLEELCSRLVPLEARERERLLAALLGPRTEHVPFVEGRLCLGRWQRLLLFSFEETCGSDWTLTLVGS
jgi:thiamine phosphate synthase YjbQ (UPF0047 family)